MCDESSAHKNITGLRYRWIERRFVCLSGPELRTLVDHYTLDVVHLAHGPRVLTVIARCTPDMDVLADNFRFSQRLEDQS